jgi:hypothetical protein
MGGALKGALNLAAVGQVNVADATGIAAQAMVQFQLHGSDIPHVADLLAAGADRALGSVSDLGEGLKYAGLLAHQTGLSIDHTVAALSGFAQAGLIGAQGSTTLQQVLRQLEAPTSKAADEMRVLGLHVFGAQGNFNGLEHRRAATRQARRDVRPGPPGRSAHPVHVSPRLCTRTAPPGSMRGRRWWRRPASLRSRRPGRWTPCRRPGQAEGIRDQHRHRPR